jgi:hypothetical protein
VRELEDFLRQQRSIDENTSHDGETDD